jgi:cytochrome oxidase Cu insertion factor (SCO1/SenC/PrrC family)
MAALQHDVPDARKASMFRKPQILIPYLLLVAALAGMGLWWQARQAADSPLLGKVVSTGSIAVGGPFTLTGQTGKRVSSSDFRGRNMLIYFGYSMCPDVCPTTLAVMADALDKIGDKAKRIVPIFITIDPERDTPKVLDTYMKAFGDQFVGLTGTTAEIAAVEKEYKVYAKKTPLDEKKGLAGGYGMDHSSVIYLMGPDGKIISFYDELIPAAKLEAELREKAK